MTKARKTLFESTIPLEKLHPIFEALRTSPASESARWMLDEVYQSFEDSDGNFLEQFQTSAFNARFFELYLFAYFSRSGFVVERPKQNPDFLVSREGVRVGIEATTLNPSTSGVLANKGTKILDLKDAELLDYEQNELPIRFGGPLSSKLEKRYWELEHCQGLPFVIAIEAFHDDQSLKLADGALIRYLYGSEEIGIWDQGDRFRVESRKIKEHIVDDKTIPSGFFSQPEARHISAVLFTNAGTSGKFSRMGYQHGIGCDGISMTRTGYCWNPRPDVMDPTFFSYNLDDPPFVENWGQGLVVLHNPNALKPLPKNFFVDAVQSHFQNGALRSDLSHWHPLSSETLEIFLGDERAKKVVQAIRPPQITIAAIPREVFQGACGSVSEFEPLVDENGWLMDSTASFFGAVLQDRDDKDWGYMVFGRDTQFRFRSIDMKRRLPTRFQARMELQQRIAAYLSHPRRIFTADTP
jgi:hypothetical protein